jgi:hypothetical protein
MARRRALVERRLLHVADDYGDAQIQGLKRALAAVGVFALAALWFTRRLPARAAGPVDT